MTDAAKMFSVSAEWDPRKKLSTYTTPELIAEMSRLNHVRKATEKRYDALKDVLDARVSVYRRLQGNTYGTYTLGAGNLQVIAKVQSQQRLDADAVKVEMGDEWWASHCKTITFSQYSIKVVEQATSVEGESGLLDVTHGVLEPANLQAAIDSISADGP